MLLGKRTNCLLVKDDVGKAKPATRNLPDHAFAFGKQTVFTEGAGDGMFQVYSIFQSHFCRDSDNDRGERFIFFKYQSVN